MNICKALFSWPFILKPPASFESFTFMKQKKKEKSSGSQICSGCFVCRLGICGMQNTCGDMEAATARIHDGFPCLESGSSSHWYQNNIYLCQRGGDSFYSKITGTVWVKAASRCAFFPLIKGVRAQRSKPMPTANFRVSASSGFSSLCELSLPAEQTHRVWVEARERVTDFLSLHYLKSCRVCFSLLAHSSE